MPYRGVIMCPLHKSLDLILVLFRMNYLLALSMELLMKLSKNITQMALAGLLSLSVSAMSSFADANVTNVGAIPPAIISGNLAAEYYKKIGTVKLKLSVGSLRQHIVSISLNLKLYL
jgi:hypothetical protein